MRALATLLLCGAALAQERAFVEVTAGKDAYYAGESIDLKLRFGFDRDFFRDHAVPLFARTMDLPVQVQAELPGWPGTYDPNAPRKGPRFAFNEEIARASSASEETREGRVFTVVETTWRTSRAEKGELAIAGPALRYAHATEFDEDFVIGRVARNPSHEVVRGSPLNLRILPLPEEGRPPEFKGAVGSYKLSARASRTSVAVGDTVQFTVSVLGHGAYREPVVDLLGFHVLGTIRGGFGGEAWARHHLKVLSADVKEIPGVRLAFFDPGPPPGYRVVSTDPIPLEVQGPAAPEPPAPQPAPAREPRTILLVLGALGALGVALAVFLRVRRRAAAPDPEALRVKAALAALRVEAATKGADSAEALARFLAAYLDVSPGAVISPDLAARLAGRGMRSAVATRVAATLERLVAARYGGGSAGGDELSSLLPEIETAIGGAGSKP